MNCNSEWLTMRDGAKIFLHRWTPEESSSHGQVLIVHGMAEHGARYARVAESLTAAGFTVFALDLRGHGESIRQGTPGHFADRGGWGRVIGDVLEVVRLMQDRLPGCPVHLVGHSLGSYIAQAFMLDHSDMIESVVLSGSTAHPIRLSRIGRLAARIEGQLRGADQAAWTMQRVSFGQFNRAFHPARTDYDWLTRDRAEVDTYVRDPWCGFACTAQMWRDLFTGLVTIADEYALSRVRKDLPVYIIGGSADPVSADNGLIKLQQRLQRSGLGEVELRVYPGARHEVFNETNRDEVMEDLLGWLERHTARHDPCYGAAHANVRESHL